MPSIKFILPLSSFIAIALTSCANETCQLAKKEEGGIRLELIKAEEEYQLHRDPKFNEEVLRSIVEPYANNPEEVSSLTKLFNRKVEFVLSNYNQLSERLKDAEVASKTACRVF